MKRTNRYRSTLPREMYLYFLDYSEGGSVPSFRKFANGKGITLQRLLSFREHKEFDEAYRECCEIRRDYLIDHALTKRFDPSFVKYLLSEGDSEEGAEDITFKLEVIQ